MTILYHIILKDNAEYDKEVSCITRQGACSQLQQIENIKSAEEIKVVSL